MTMKKTRILYWVFTILFAGFMLMSAIPDIFITPDVEKVFKGLGYPLYISPFLGVAKTLGCIAIVVPGFARIKEWAYAGLFFDLAGAIYSIVAVGTPFKDWAILILPLVIGVLSYVYYHKLRQA
jgi:uncharacterized membrane protein YphA (DoxX/SURF4 family)